jgi:hypothetical protein
MIEITKRVTFDVTKIYFGEVLHLAVVRREIVALQSWKSCGVWFIEITFKCGASVLAEYDTPEKWQRVIELITEDLTL